MIRGRVLDPTNQQRETTDGKVWARLGMQVGGVTRRYVELGGAGRSLEVNDKREAGHGDGEVLGEVCGTRRC